VGDDVARATKFGKAPGPCPALGANWVNHVYSLEASPPTPAPAPANARHQTKTGRKLLGCFGDGPARAMTALPGPYITPDACAAAARGKGARYMGLQDAQPNGTSQCFYSNDYHETTTKYGPHKGACAPGGGPWINAVYDLQ